MHIIQLTGLDLKPLEYAEICDLVYRRKITADAHLYDIMNRFKLVYTQRSLK